MRVEAGMAVMVVQVRQVVNTNISYLVEGDTGRIEVVHYH